MLCRCSRDSRPKVRRPGRGPAVIRPRPRPSLEFELGAEFNQAPAHYLCRVLPLVIRGGPPGVLVEDRTPVEDVVDVGIRPQPGLCHAEDPGETDVQLLDPIVEQRVEWDQAACRSVA